MTDLTALRLPPQARRWLTDHPREDLQRGRPVQVNLDWWNRAIAGLPGGPVTGRPDGTPRDGGDAPSPTVDHGRGWITREDLFALASTRASTPEQVLTLMWHVLAWGSGLKPRQNLKRIASLTAQPAHTADVLVRAGELAASDPAGAYRLLRPRSRTAFRSLGPAFFTKYLYFTGAGAPNHPSLILDARVATALRDAHGWNSLGTSAWPDVTYRRYSDLLTRWAKEASRPGTHGGVGRPVGADELELYLFMAGA